MVCSKLVREEMVDGDGVDAIDGTSCVESSLVALGSVACNI